MKNLSDKERRLNNLLYNTPCYFGSITEMNYVISCSPFSTVHSEICVLKDELGIGLDELLSMWLRNRRLKRENEELYNKKPTKRRKDNGSEINYGSRRSNRNKIRYPKKVRKTAWKRFHKLFPHLKKKI